jgi:2-oxoisovalerate dehydrogenase E1 component alpha subunit
MTAHSSSDDPTRYQPADWAARAAARDPVGRLELWMREHGLLTEEAKARVDAETEGLVRVAVETAEATPPPTPASLTEDVYASRVSERLPHPG